MAKIDFPPASSSPFTAPNGVIYLYIGSEPNGYWSGTDTDGQASLKFVEVTGDNMTGDLTLGTDKITLDATNGSAEFQGTIQVGDGYLNPINSGKYGGVFSENGFVIARRNDDTNYVWQGYGVSSPQPTSTINSDGSAEFARQVFSTRYSEDSGLSINYNGTDYGYALYDQTSLKAGIKLDGSASFENGAITLGAVAGITGPGGIVATTLIVNQANGANNVFIGRENGADKVLISGNGSASFNGSVTAASFSGDGSSLTNVPVPSTVTNATNCSRSVTGSNGLSGGGVLNANQVISGVNASTSVKGVVQLSSSISSTSTTLAATASAAKTAYDRGTSGLSAAQTAQTRADTAVSNAAAAQTTANNALPKTGGTISGSLVVTGDIQSNSDISLKTNIQPLENTLEKVCQLRGVRYDRTDMEKDNCIGVIAQEVEEIYPEFVGQSEDGIKSVDYSKLVSVLIEAVKDLKAEIATIKKDCNC